MADASSVGQALAYVCAGIIYPNGLNAASLTGRQTVVRRGWLLPSDLFTAQNIRNGIDFVTVTLSSHDSRVCAEPLGRPWRTGEQIGATVSVGVEGGGVRVVLPSGVAATGVIGIWNSAVGISSCVAYAARQDDNASKIAAGLADVFPGAVVDGSLIRVPGIQLNGRVVGYGQSYRITRRQGQRYRVSIWTADATVREALGGQLDAALAELSWLATPDGGQAQIMFCGVEDVDTMQNQALYRRDYLYELIFDAIQTQWSPGMLSGGGEIQGAGWVSGFGTSEASIAQQSATEALEAMAAAVSARQGAQAYPGLSVDRFGTVISTV
ncbi:hypothetical protein [Gluconobacter wancherniae]|uniref:hypothetical protein n=1 Tax=Gluconobacter wancherniae TaxID=1307955 RepID=UPI001B8CB478|nr:hypothetical protein [Gluconobacter wancherniae]MBS1088455.1 hypothetical protein [Gluconobacter wancherniae]